MTLVGIVFALILIVLAAFGGIAGGIKIAKWHYRTEVKRDLRRTALERLINVGSRMNLYYMLIPYTTSGPVLKATRQRCNESLMVLAELEEVIRALGDYPDLLKRVRNLSEMLISFGNFCETTAIPGFSKIPVIFEEQLGNFSSIHKRLIEDISEI